MSDWVKGAATMLLAVAAVMLFGLVRACASAKQAEEQAEEARAVVEKVVAHKVMTYPGFVLVAEDRTRCHIDGVDYVVIQVGERYLCRSRESWTGLRGWRAAP